MIRIKARLSDGATRLEVEGHEGHLEGGRVCAAVSAITQTALLGLEQVARMHPDLVSIDIQEE
ncbi:ribosomal-processing cysteine protease Prp [Streptomyces sp. PAM3C]|uniref:ribosomal-processing cysteine protease Prp n=1 Tax=Streptomyces sp. PAM3C TaxID=2847300 RepID=UPI001C1E3641|nr:ribosomal-processing cysteine protease Prp [Streptomyces sp. PAM3C]MBU5946803.1 ribosomal-processing cysteine protease Prp [Streptomyces sp. PAM3C]